MTYAVVFLLNEEKPITHSFFSENHLGMNEEMNGSFLAIKSFTPILGLLSWVFD